MPQQISITVAQPPLTVRIDYDAADVVSPAEAEYIRDLIGCFASSVAHAIALGKLLGASQVEQRTAELERRIAPYLLAIQELPDRPANPIPKEGKN